MPHARPKISRPEPARPAISTPRTASTAPGMMNRCVGLWTSRKRRCRQPSRKLDSFDSPPRGWYSIGNSAIFRCSLEARITISEANSMPVVRRSRRGSTSRRSARMPQWASFTPGAEEEVQEAREQRVADVAVQPRHRAGLDVVHAVAHHELGAVVQLGHEAGDLVEVIREVGVGHHDVLAAARRRSRRDRRCRSRAGARRRRVRPRRRPARPSRLRRRCRRRAPRRRSRRRCSAPSAAATQTSMFSASFRQGITTDTSGAWRRRHPWGWGALSGRLCS